MPESVSLTIDGQEIRAPKGTMVLEAARTAGILIPHYCYHPGLPVVGSCRMCLVEIEKVPKLQPSCATPVAEGMVVRTTTPQALENRRSVLEFLLANHPLDCPVCDQAGECGLQDYYMEHGRYDARHDEDKTRRKKAVPLGPHIMLDQERCILCTRCVRFTRDITRTGELGVLSRGHRSVIDVFPGTTLDNPYSGNVADLCPVGALTDRDFRFQCRVWFLGSVPSICPGCSRGCNIEIHYNRRFDPRYHDRRVHRLKPRPNPEVNGFWICDEGRYAYRTIDAADRLKIPALRRGDGLREASWAEAIGEAAGALRGVLGGNGPGAAAVMVSPQMSNEELFLARRLFRDRLGIDRIAGRAPAAAGASGDDFLIRADKNPNTRGMDLLFPDAGDCRDLVESCAGGRIRYLHIFRHDLSRWYDPGRLAEALREVDCVVFEGSWDSPTARLADVVLPAAVYAEKEGTFVNFQGRVQRFYPAVPPPGAALTDLDILARLAAALEAGAAGSTAAGLFGEIAAHVPEFAPLTWQSLGPTGRWLANPGNDHAV
ncbi:MAG: molybdopterin-dependent oxidoreductase [Acidobacteria bacterium]|nr:molybdopterin-dependent oxidoreductase [Acidobacteriota bacterium]